MTSTTARQQNGLDDPENRGAGADAERDDRNRGVASPPRFSGIREAYFRSFENQPCRWYLTEPKAERMLEVPHRSAARQEILVLGS